jgi:uncharacterized membrane protein YhhN
MGGLEKMKPHELLMFLGGLLAILLGAIFFVIEWSRGIPSTRLWSTVLVLVVDVVLGAFLWITFLVAKRNVMNAGIMAVVVSIILMAFGQTPGIIGGVAGLLGGLLAIVLPLVHVKA